jgi:hypothetical protein
VDAPCWTAPRHTEFVAGDLGDRLKRVEIELDLGYRAVRQYHAAVRRPRLYADLAESVKPLRNEELNPHESAQVFRRGILMPDLAYLAAHGNRDAARFDLADEMRKLGTGRIVVELLFLQIGLAKIDQRRRIDIDIVETVSYGLADKLLQRVDLFLGSSAYFLALACVWSAWMKTVLHSLP